MNKTLKLLFVLIMVLSLIFVCACNNAGETNTTPDVGENSQNINQSGEGVSDGESNMDNKDENNENNGNSQSDDETVIIGGISLPDMQI